MSFRINLLGENDNSGETSIILVSLFLIGGLILTGYGVTQYWGQSQSLDNAVNIAATVTDTNIRTDSSRRGGIDYQAEINFDYSYEGEKYSSDFIYPLDDDKEFNRESTAEEFLQDYSGGEQVEAYVNPSEPENAFLKDSRSNEPLILMLIGGLMAAISSYKLAKNVL